MLAYQRVADAGLGRQDSDKRRRLDRWADPQELEAVQVGEGDMWPDATLPHGRVARHGLLVQPHPTRHVHPQDIALRTSVQQPQAGRAVQFERQQQPVAAHPDTSDLHGVLPGG